MNIKNMLRRFVCGLTDRQENEQFLFLLQEAAKDTVTDAQENESLGPDWQINWTEGFWKLLKEVATVPIQSIPNWRIISLIDGVRNAAHLNSKPFLSILENTARGERINRAFLDSLDERGARCRIRK